MDRLRREAAAAGFEPATFEKVLRLLDLLGRIEADQALAPMFVLKGGTALNLFVFREAPRLSVDIDLNFIGDAHVERMRAVRPEIEDRLLRLCASAGLVPRRRAPSHAGGKWILPYTNALGGRDRIEIDLNYVLRVPLWEPTYREAAPLAARRASRVRVLDEHELAGGKIVALLTRTATRDLFDAVQLLTVRALEDERLRVASVVYGAMSQADWRTVSPDDISVDGRDVRAKLAPVLRAGVREAALSDPRWGERLRDECRAGLRRIFPLTKNEYEFLTALRDGGEIRPELLTANPELGRRIAAQPMLHWRAQQRNRTAPGPSGEEALG